MITGKTFTAQYDGREDRLRLILNYADAAGRIDFMITRAMLLRLFPALEQLLPRGAKAVRPPKREEVPQQQGMSRTDMPTLQLTRTAAPTLLQKVDFKLHKDAGRITLLFYGDLPDTPEAQSTLTTEGLEQVVGIILGAIPFLDWGIAPNILEH